MEGELPHGVEERLVGEGWISYDTLQKVKLQQKTTKSSLFSLLLQGGYLTEEEVFMFFGSCCDVPFVRINDYMVDVDTFSLLDDNFCRENFVLPLFRMENNLFIAMANPLDTSLISEISRITGMDVHPLISTPHSIIKFLDERSGLSEKMLEIETLLFSPQRLKHFPLHRGTKRIQLVVPVDIKLEDKRIRLHRDNYISASVFDVSSDYAALGIATDIFVPQSTEVSIRFKKDTTSSLVCRGEVLYSRMRRAGEFFMGVRIKTNLEKVRDFLSSRLDA